MHLQFVADIELKMRASERDRERERHIHSSIIVQMTAQVCMFVCCVCACICAICDNSQDHRHNNLLNAMNGSCASLLSAA